MITDRPLREIPVRALYALHMGIEKRERLITSILAARRGAGIEVCAMGVMLMAYEQLLYSTHQYIAEINYSQDSRWEKLGANAHHQVIVATLNNNFKGTPEQRREFMLRHIVEELRARGKSIDRKAATKKEPART